MIHLPEEFDALYLGLTVFVDGRGVFWKDRAAFAKRLNHGPWDRIVRRRDDARRERERRTELMAWLYQPTDPTLYGWPAVDWIHPPGEYLGISRQGRL